MAVLSDLAHYWGQDLQVSPTGDIAICSGWEKTVTRVYRRLMTAPTTADQSDYVWQPDFGVGLGERVGEVLDVRAVTAVVRSQVLKERSVARKPQPRIVVQEMAAGEAVIDIRYSDLAGVPQTFSLNLSIAGS